MKLKLLIVACFAVTCSLTIPARQFLLPTSQAAVQGQKLPGDEVIIPSDHEKWGKVKFTHAKHFAYSDCVYCHHTNAATMTAETFKAGKEAKVQQCNECHIRKEGDPKNPKSAVDQTELWSYNAYHYNCIECHKGEIIHKTKAGGAIKKQAEGPTKCAECHEKKD